MEMGTGPRNKGGWGEINILTGNTLRSTPISTKLLPPRHTDKATAQLEFGRWLQSDGPRGTRSTHRTSIMEKVGKKAWKVLQPRIVAGV